MQEQEQVRRIPIGIIAGVSAVVLASGFGSWWLFKTQDAQRVPPPVGSISESVPSPVQVPVAPQSTVQVYWLKDTATGFEVAATTIPLSKAKNKPEEVLTSAFEGLLSGPVDSQLSSSIPEGTKLRSIKVRQDGIHIDLSSEFTKGGGSTSMSGRLAQVVYTATSLNPDAKVWINVEGQKLQDLGGEGLEVPQPTTRTQLNNN